MMEEDIPFRFGGLDRLASKESGGNAGIERERSGGERRERAGRGIIFEPRSTTPSPTVDKLA